MSKKLKRLSVTISHSNHHQLKSTRKTFNDQRSVEHTLLKSLEELVFLAATNEIAKDDFRKAIYAGLDKANSLHLVDQDIPF